jgi:excisionase family DNA binding protein
MSDEIMTIRELAVFLKIKEKTAYKLVAEGKLPGFKVGGAWRFKRDDLEEWITRQKDEQNG